MWTSEKRSAGRFFETNIRPNLMTREQLKAGTKWLVNNIYSPSAFARRLEAFGGALRYRGDSVSRARPGQGDVSRTGKRLAAYGSEEQDLLARMDRLFEKRPELAHAHADRALAYYCQARYLFEVSGAWDPSLARQAAPLAA